MPDRREQHGFDQQLLHDVRIRLALAERRAPARDRKREGSKRLPTLMHAMSSSVAAAVSSAIIGLTFLTTAFVNVSAARQLRVTAEPAVRAREIPCAPPRVSWFARRPTTNTDVYDRQPPTIGIQTSVFRIVEPGGATPTMAGPAGQPVGQMSSNHRGVAAKIAFPRVVVNAETDARAASESVSSSSLDRRIGRRRPARQASSKKLPVTYALLVQRRDRRLEWRPARLPVRDAGDAVIVRDRRRSPSLRGSSAKLIWLPIRPHHRDTVPVRHRQLRIKTVRKTVKIATDMPGCPARER
jgi:hypothetical protein